MLRLFLLALTAVSLSGCVGLEDLYREVERYDPRYENYPDSRTDRYGSDVRRDVDRYLRDVDRAVRLDPRQERDLGRLLEDRAYDFSRRGRYDRDRYDRDRYVDSPFPRSRNSSREVQRWWSDTDRAIERRLDRRQRDAYRRFVRRFDDRRYRDRRDTRWDRRDRDWDDDDDDDDDDDWDDDDD
jgi:hypothetical protein